MLLTPSKVSSSLFSFKDDKFVAEVSELGKTLNFRSFQFGRVFDDACDIGFTIVSEKTGKHAVFAMTNRLYDTEELQAWEFVCVTPGLQYLKATIFND